MAEQVEELDLADTNNELSDEEAAYLREHLRKASEEYQRGDFSRMFSLE